MAMIKPIALNLSSFDATENHIFYFLANGGDQVVKNTIEIYDNETNVLVFTNTSITFKFENEVVANSLVNDTTYYYRIKTYDASDNESEWSNQIQFTCYTKATISFQNISQSVVINASSYQFNMLYSQIEGEKLNSYIVDLYNSSNSLISSSGTKYIGEYVGNSVEFSYTFNGFVDNETYKVECRCSSQLGAEISTDKITFFVDYFYPSVFTLFSTTNNPTDGRIDLDVNIRLIDGISNPSPPIYINSESIDLRNSGYYVKWIDGYTIVDNMTLRLFFYNPMELTDVNEKLLCVVSNADDEELNKNRIEITYVQEYAYETETVESVIRLDCYSDSTLAYVAYSNAINVPLTSEKLIAFVVKKDNVFSIVLNKIV